jgi:DNA methylase
MQKETDYALKLVLRAYQAKPKPLEVNFRELVGWMPYQADRATHLVHPYPAKLLPHIPYFFLNNELLSKPNDIIVDPFCGSGSVLVEALLAGRNACGIDCNPLAVLLSHVKTTELHELQIKETLRLVLRCARSLHQVKPPDVINLHYWYLPRIIGQLSRLKLAILRICHAEVRDFFLTCLSVCVRRLSLADPRVSVPVRLRPDQYSDSHPLSSSASRRLTKLCNISVFEDFQQSVEQNAIRVASLRRLVPGKQRAVVLLGTAMDLKPRSEGLENQNASLVITSPPYAGAQKYIRACSLSLNWLELCGPGEFRTYERRTVGREHYATSEYQKLAETASPDANRLLSKIWKRYPLRAHIAASYLNEMQESIRQIHKILRRGGYLVLVTGNNQICGHEFLTTNYLSEIARTSGLRVRLQLVDDIRSRGLMTKRNSTASVISREWVTVFRKSPPHRYLWRKSCFASFSC